MRLRDSALTDEFLRKIPKAELHIHIEGSLEPEMMCEMATRNGVRLRYVSVGDVREAYDFSNLQSFLDLYYEGTQVLLYERDFYELTWAYLKKASSQGNHSISSQVWPTRSCPKLWCGFSSSSRKPIPS